MGQSILTRDQKTILEIAGGNARIAELFYLSGGTALAEFYLRHRYSDDLDFFTDASPFPQLEVEAIIGGFKKGIGAASVAYRKLYDRRIFFLTKESEELKLEFTPYPFPHIEPPKMHGGVFVDSLKDIAANKLMALIDRVEAKDFIDMYYLMTDGKMTLKEIAHLTNMKFHISLDPVALGSELSKVRAITLLPKMIKEITLRELKDFFSAEAKKLKPEIFT